MRGRLRRLLRPWGERRDLDDELDFHFERTVEGLTAAGMSLADAHAEAARRFGDVAAYRAQLEAIDRRGAVRRRRRDRAGAILQSLAHASRSLLREPGLSAGVVTALALGIGANAVMYGIVERLLLRPPAHVEDPESVRRLYVDLYFDFLGERTTNSAVAYPDYRDWQEATTFSVAAYTTRGLSVGRGLDARSKRAVYATPAFFDLLGVRPALGRFYTHEEDRFGGEQLAVLSWGAWQRDFGGDPDVLGRTLDFGYGPYTVVGVTPRGFTGVDLAPVDFFLPFHVVSAQTTGTEWVDRRDWFWFSVVARLAPGATVVRAEAEATALHLAGRRPDMASGEYGDDPAVLLTSVIAARGPEAPGEAVVAKLLLAVSAVVLLIAALNVANLLLARTLRQRREIAVRLALGVSRRRLIGQITLEGVLLALAGGVLAGTTAHAGTRALGRVLLADVQWEEVGTGPSFYAVILALALAAGVLSGAVPALQAVRGRIHDPLRQAGAGGITRTTGRVRTTLALAQTALTVLLLVGAGLFVRSLDRARNADLGFDPDGLVYVFPRAGRGELEGADQRRVYEAARDRVAALPGVRAVGLTAMAPFYGSRSAPLRADGLDSIRSPGGGPYVMDVSPGFFEAMDLRIEEGRGFTPLDGDGAPRVVVVSASMARGLWPDRSPLGQCLRIGRPADGAETPCSEVVGVVEDSRRNTLRPETSFQYYVPLAQGQVAEAPDLLVARLDRTTPEALDAIRRVVAAVDSRIQRVSAQPLDEILAPQMRSWRLGATMFGIFGLLALAVAALGLYSVLAFDVAQRTREIGVRAALGASTGRLLGMTLGRALAVAAAGAGAGSVLALLLAGRVEPLLFGVEARDPLTFGVVILVILAVAAGASTLPALCAARVQPVEALRAE